MMGYGSPLERSDDKVSPVPVRIERLVSVLV